MFIISCPYCGERDQTEFSCHGEAHIARPLDTDTLSDEQWGDYVFFRQNPKGMHRERWVHVHGCRRWFNALRSTVTDEIFATYKVGDEQPPLPENPS
ncbi:sarcosine oxidase subunit delta [Chromatiales bacterium (ex Bugula neritina AB1)]|nr:sarcosine oxidase subunit delta [Chromatiales bacterium (ex Bugula neritina AB1)]